MLQVSASSVVPSASEAQQNQGREKVNLENEGEE